MLCHIDADSFFASVLVRQFPRLRGKALLALGMGGGCVIAASYEAKAKGVKTGMPLKQALELVPDAIHMPSDFREACLASEQIERMLCDVCPFLEQMSVDEWYLDLCTVPGGVPGDLQTFAQTIRQTILRATGLSVSIGIAPSKLLAKMASEYRKPGGVTVLYKDVRTEDSEESDETEDYVSSSDSSASSVSSVSFKGMHPNCMLQISDFLRDRPAAAIPGIGRRRQLHTESLGWTTAWDVAHAPTDALIRICGRPGEEMQRELRGERVTGLTTERPPPKSVSRCRSFRAADDARLLWAHLLRHAEYTVLKLRRHHLACRGISVWLRDTHYEHRSSHCSLPQPIDNEERLQPYLRRCLRRLHHARTRYTQIGLALWHLTPKGAAQPSLFEDPRSLGKEEEIQRALDSLHERFGRNAITRGSSLSVRSGTRMELGVSIYE